MNLLLLVCWILDDGFLSIDDMLLELMGQHACNHGNSHIYFPLFKYKLLACRSTNCSDVLTLNRGTFERLCNLVPGFGHLCVLIRTEGLSDEWCTVVLTVKHMVSFHEAVWALVNSSLLYYNRVLVTWFPGFTRRRAASAQRWAAIIRSAFLPVWGLS